MNDDRAIRYRRLAMREIDPSKSKLLRLLADEAERGILHSPSCKIQVVTGGSISTVASSSDYVG